MWSFFSRKQEVEPSTKEQFTALKARILRLEAEVLDIAAAQEIIRNKVLRKIQKQNPKEDEEESKTPGWTKDLLTE